MLSVLLAPGPISGRFLKSPYKEIQLEMDSTYF
jgi:hypothetical protein